LLGVLVLSIYAPGLLFWLVVHTPGYIGDTNQPLLAPPFPKRQAIEKA